MFEHPDFQWQLPDPLSVLEVAVDAETVILVRRHGNPGGPRLVLSHGNGMAIDLYYPFWSILSDTFDLVMYDLRNHGWNKVSSMDGHNIPTLVSDHDLVLEAIEREWGQKPQAGVFHSVSALITLLSPTQGDRYSALVLFDPPICKPGRSHREFEAAAVQAAGFALRRTDKFRHREEFAEVLPLHPAFRRMVPGAFDLMALTTLRPSDGEEGFELRCPRDYEAQIFSYASVYGVAVDFESLVCPVKVIGADPTLPFSYLPTLDLSDILSVDYDFLPEATHFLQLERPQECAAALRDYLASLAIS
ncbi:MAG: alpha/beta hydrolase [Chloroflexota bacterium]|nr:alpha/beta hydrolase [Chloroflexota bacterium]